MNTLAIIITGIITTIILVKTIKKIMGKKEIDEDGFLMGICWIESRNENLEEIEDGIRRITNTQKSNDKLAQKHRDRLEEVKQELLGTIVKITGRIKKNQMFDRLEFTATKVDSNPDPEEEINKLEETGSVDSEEVV